MTPHEARREARRVGRMTAAEWADHRRRVKAERGRDEEPEVLGPAIAFSDRRVDAARRRALMPERLDEETGPQSRTVTDRLLLRLRGMDGDAERGRVLRRATNRRAHHARAIHRARLVAGGHRRRALIRPHRGCLHLAATDGRHPGMRPRALPPTPPDQRAEHAMDAARPPHDGRRDTHEDESSSWREHREISSRGSTARCSDTCALTGGGIPQARWDHRES